MPQSLLQNFPAKDVKEFLSGFGPYAENAENFDQFQASLLQSLRDLGGLRALHGADGPESPEEIFFKQACPSLSSAYYIFSLIEALKTNSPDLLLRGLEIGVRYSYAWRGLHYLADDSSPGYRMEYQSRPEKSLTFDHSLYRYDVLSAYACGRPGLARRFFRRGMGLSGLGQGYERHMTNLCMAAMYDDDDWKEQSLRDAHDYFKKTKAVYERAFVRFFAAVLEHDPESMSESLHTLAQASPKLMWFRDVGNKRIFCLALHGMYGFAARHTPGAVFAAVSRPGEQWWWNDYADALVSAPCPRPPAEAPFEFSGELAFINGMRTLIDLPPGDPAPFGEGDAGTSAQGRGVLGKLRGFFK